MPPDEPVAPENHPDAAPTPNGDWVADVMAGKGRGAPQPEAPPLGFAWGFAVGFLVGIVVVVVVIAVIVSITGPVE